jgi:hypothetical protein
MKWETPHQYCNATPGMGEQKNKTSSPYSFIETAVCGEHEHLLYYCIEAAETGFIVSDVPSRCCNNLIASASETGFERRGQPTTTVWEKQMSFRAAEPPTLGRTDTRTLRTILQDAQLCTHTHFTVLIAFP